MIRRFVLVAGYRPAILKSSLRAALNDTQSTLSARNTAFAGKYPRRIRYLLFGKTCTRADINKVGDTHYFRDRYRPDEKR